MKKRILGGLLCLMCFLSAAGAASTVYAAGLEEDDYGTVYRNDDGSLKGEGWFQIEDNWYYIDAGGHLMKAAITPDGYYVDMRGRYEAGQYDYLIGTYRLISEKTAGASEYKEVSAASDGSECLLTVRNTADNCMTLTEKWQYANGSVLRSWTEDYKPVGNGTFNQIYYLTKNENTYLYTNTPKYNNNSKMTDSGNGQITLQYPDGNGIYYGVFQKQ